jgi:hypothetical protein
MNSVTQPKYKLFASKWHTLTAIHDTGCMHGHTLYSCRYSPNLYIFLFMWLSIFPFDSIRILLNLERVERKVLTPYNLPAFFLYEINSSWTEFLRYIIKLINATCCWQKYIYIYIHTHSHKTHTHTTHSQNTHTHSLTKHTHTYTFTKHTHSHTQLCPRIYWFSIHSLPQPLPPSKIEKLNK